MPHGIQEMANIILADYAEWWHRGTKTGDWKQQGIIFMRGEAGVGKTEVMYQIASALAEGQAGHNLPKLPQANPLVQLFFNAAMDPESIAGTPAPTRLKIQLPDGKEVEKLALTMHYRQELLLPMRFPPGALLFCDEMGRDAPHMRALQLKLLSPEKTLAGLDMNHFYIVCAGNPSDEHHRVDDIMADAAMAGGRLLPFDVQAKPSEWADWMYDKADRLGRPTYKEVANFILDNTGMLIGRDDEDNPASAFHCPRSWTAAAEKIHVHGGGDAKKVGRLDEGAALYMVQAAVGPFGATELESYMNQDRPMTVRAILAGRFQTDKHGRIRDGVVPSVVRNLQDYLQKEDLDDTQAENVANFIKAISADIAHGIVRDNRKILAANLAALSAHDAFGNIMSRVKNLDEYAKEA